MTLRQDILAGRYRLIAQEEVINKATEQQFKAMISKWTAELRRAVKGGVLSPEMVRRAAMLSNLNAITKSTVAAVRSIVGKQYADTFKSERLKTQFLVQGAVAKVDLNMAASFDDISIEAMRMAIANPIVGASITKNFSRMSSSTLQAMRKDVAEAVANGWTVDALAKKWAAGRGAGRIVNDAKSLARTSLMAASNNAAINTYRSLGRDTVYGVRWDATFDVRTCMVCASRHGSVWSIDAAPPVPVHLNCRCVLLPIFADRSMDDAMSKQAYVKKDGTVAYRNQDRAFDVWLRKQGKEVARDFFQSESKYRLWSRGVSFDRMISPSGSIYTDAQLATKGLRV